MSIRIKVLSLSVVLFSLILLAQYLVQLYVTYPSFVNLETYEARQNIGRAVNAIEREVVHLDTTCNDWAAWDYMYDYMATRDKGFIASNLTGEILAENGLNFGKIVDNDGRVIWSESVDLQTQEPIELPGLNPDAYPADHLLISHGGESLPPEERKVAGVMLLGDTPVLVSSRPILTSSGTGPIRGTLILGHLLDNVFIRSLALQTRVDFDIKIATEPDMQALVRRIEMSDGGEILIEPFGSDRLRVYSLYPDIFGKPALLIYVTLPREITRQGMVSIRNAMLITAVAGALFAIIMIVWLGSVILDPLIKLTRHAERIEEEGDYTLKLSLKRSDEIGTLANRFDNMVERVATQTEKLMEANKELERLADLDGLTKIANRRALDAKMASEWGRLARSGKALSLIMCDIDLFKSYNDTYGHGQGDECLKRIADTLQHSAKRASDMAARYGGEEFAVVLPETGEAQAFHLAERIREAVEELGIAHAASEVKSVVTISLGVATVFPSPRSMPDTLLKAADAALYKAKQEGRNRTVRYDQGDAAGV